MSAFRAITAEEEAATALILALKMRQYPGADVLKYNNHVHKSAVFFIMREANNFLAEGRKVPFETYLHTIGPLRVMVEIEVPAANGEGHWIAQLDNPLNFFIYPDGDPNGARNIFADRFSDFLTKASKRNIEEYLIYESNFRNRILYASDEGVPSLEITDNFILERVQRVRMIGMATIAILQDRGRQLLVQQCLEVFLGAMRQLSPTSFDFEAAVKVDNA